MDTTIAERSAPHASIIGMGVIKWKLAEFLEENKLTAYRLATTLDSHTRTPTIYRIAKKGVELSRVDFTVLATVIEGLKELTGKEVGVSDLLEYQEEA